MFSEQVVWARHHQKSDSSSELKTVCILYSLLCNESAKLSDFPVSSSQSPFLCISVAGMPGSGPPEVTDMGKPPGLDGRLSDSPGWWGQAQVPAVWAFSWPGFPWNTLQEGECGV